METEHLFSVTEIAKRMGLHVNTIRNWVKMKEDGLKAVNVGKGLRIEYRIKYSDLELFCRKHGIDISIF